MPQISVIIPVYNVEKYIRECLDSVITQTFFDIEIILVDDGSSDKSGDILDEYTKNDKRITVIHKANGGVSAARNDGIAASGGEYLYIMDSDDYLEQDALETMYKNAVQTGADVVITDNIAYTESGQKFENNLFKEEFVSDSNDWFTQLQKTVLENKYSPSLSDKTFGPGIAAPWNKLIKRDVIMNNHLSFDPYVKGIFDDGLFSLHVFQYAKRVSYIHHVTYHYRVLNSSLIHKYNPNRVDICRKINEKINEFLLKYKKEKELRDAANSRIIRNLNIVFKLFLFHKSNQMDVKTKYHQFRALLDDPVNSRAIKDAQLDKMEKSGIITCLLTRLKFYHILFALLSVVYGR